MLDLHPGLMIWTIISFLILLMILNKAAWKPILKALDQREKGIKESIAAAEIARKEADEAQAKHKAQMADAQAEAQAIIAKARADAERIGDQLKAKHKAEADAILDKAQKQIEQERDSAIKEIRNKIAELAVNAAERVIGKSLNVEDHRKLVMDGLDEGGRA